MESCTPISHPAISRCDKNRKLFDIELNGTYANLSWSGTKYRNATESM